MQPQQQTTVVSGVQQPYIVNAAPTRPFNDRQASVVGVILTILGCFSILFNVIDLAIGTGVLRYNSGGRLSISYQDNTLSHSSLGVAGHGLWCGALFIFAGAFGVGAGRNKTVCMINAFLILTIIGTVFAAIQFLVAAIGAGTMQYEDYIDILHCDDAPDYSATYIVCRELRAVFAMEILLALLGVVAFAVCLWGSILCCVNKGCCASNPVVAFAMMPASQPQVTVVSQQQQQPTGTEQPVGYPQPAGYPAGQQPAGYYK